MELKNVLFPARIAPIVRAGANRYTFRAAPAQYVARSAFLSGLPIGVSGIALTKSSDFGACTEPLASLTRAISSSRSASTLLHAGLQHHQRLHGLAPALVRHADHRDLRHRRVRRDHVLDLAREHVEAAGDHHVLLAVDDVQEALAVEAGDVAGVQPAAGEGLGGLLGQVVVALHHQRGAHAELAGLPGGNGLVVVVEQRHVHPRRRAPAGGETLGLRQVVLGLLHVRQRHRRLGLAEVLVEDVAPLLDALAQARRAHRRGAVEDRLQARQIRGRRARRIEQRVDHHRHQHGRGDAVLLDHVEEEIRREAARHVERAAALQHRDEEGRGRVRERRAHQHAQLLGELPLGHLQHRQVGAAARGRHHALGLAGGAAGVVDRAHVVGADVGRHERRRRESRGEREVVLADRAGSESQQVLQARAGVPSARRRAGRRPTRS